MNVLELMDAKASSFSKNDAKIYESIKKFPETFAECSITEISNNSGFTKAALTRFAQKLGFSGFTEFQYQFLKDTKEIDLNQKKKISEVYCDVIKRTEEMIKEDDLILIVKKLMTSHAVYLKGSSLSRLPAEELNIGLRLTSDITPNFIQEDIDAVSFRKDDVLIIFSARSGDSHTRICRKLRENKENGPFSVLVTTNAKHPLRHNFSYMIILPSVSMAESKDAQLSDTFAFLMFNEILIKKIKESNYKN